MKQALRLGAAVAIIVVCWRFRDAFERDPVTHVLLQLPLLALAGALITQAAIEGKSWQRSPWLQGGLAPILIAIFTIAFWMLPRSIDAALTDPAVELLKFVTMPALIGAPLVIGWPRAHPLLRGFLKAEAVSMLAVMAFLYTHAPVRICNAYLVDDQERLGFGFLVAAVMCALMWTWPIFWNQKAHPSLDIQAARP
ncbi:MAG: hypothetical protein ACR2RE_07935 [Geminicoccaceae bacterium]